MIESNNRLAAPAWWCAWGLAGMGGLAAWRWGSPLAVGIASGVLWHLASLACLVRMLEAWLGPAPSPRRAVGWLLLKFPLLYGAAYLALRSPAVSLLGFGLGFTLVLLLAIGWFILQAQRPLALRPHGR